MRALGASLSLVLPFALWHLALLQRGSAYLLFDLVAPKPWILFLHLLSLVLGAFLTFPQRRIPPWYPPLLLLAFALTCTAALFGAFLTFSSSTTFLPFVLGTAVLTGLLLGAFLVTHGRLVAALNFDRSAFFDLIRMESLAILLLLAVLYLLAAEHLGQLRLGLLLALGCALTAHLTLRFAPAGAMQSKKAARWCCYGLALLQIAAEPLTPLREVGLASDPVVLARNTPSGRLTLTSGRGAFQLHVDGLLRLSTIDSARRREVTAHPAMLAAPQKHRVLVLGGGDGGVVREVLRYEDVREVTVIEPEEGLLELSVQHPVLSRENGGALRSPRVKVRRADPVQFLDEAALYDVILVDLLDPEGPRRSKWYTRHFYQRLGEHLAPGGIGVIATNTSPFAQRQAFWCVVTTLEAAGWQVLPYRAPLPTMGSWGFALISRQKLVAPTEAPLPPGLVYLDSPTLSSLFHLAPDEQRIPTEVNLLHRQVLARYRAMH
ncbi:MAG: hypothetical protein RMJ98_00495 [Myxococcales bacterium]|nr:hypothetical protein [Polyangiaceae bacterium]MDW8247765.1 hypothetical protein [Myxococcales bacterium]